jgi:hypothetical protein
MELLSRFQENNMGLEKPGPMPENNELPLRIIEAEEFEHQGRESTVTKVKVLDSNEQEKLIALKKVKKEEFASMEEMKKAKKFYDYLKSVPGFGKFVADTLFLKARETPGENPHAYRLQKLIEGKRLDELTDEKLYSEPELTAQLLEFIDAAIAALEQTSKADVGSPDFYGNRMFANYLFNPRHSSNVVIANRPDETGNKIFLVDISKQAQQVSGVGKSFQKHIGSKLQIAQLKKWKKIVERHLIKK